MAIPAWWLSEEGLGVTVTQLDDAVDPIDGSLVASVTYDYECGIVPMG
jgi:hypothetical protein